jgi:putative inorganic carbon (HCO3(-)) transporter
MAAVPWSRPAKVSRMLRSLYLSLVYGMFLCAGIMAPFAFGLGYVWVDNFTPQRVVYSILTDLPVSEIMAVGCIGAYLFMDRRAPPRPNLVTLLGIAMLCWITYTTFSLAVEPEFAYAKWNWAFKTVIFALFMPALFRSRTQIEAFMQIYVFSLGAQYLPFAGKTLLSGGRYGASFGVVAGNSGLAEGSTLATACMIAALMCLYLARHQTILPNLRIVRLMFIGMAAACVIAGIGTYERTALIGIAVVAGTLWLQSRRKLTYGLLAFGAIAAFALYLMTSESEWAQRMLTISDTQESSTQGRLLVWRWTLNFVQTHPFGGGFYAYMTDTIAYPPSTDLPEGAIVHGKAFHSIYFEMLGENGWPGLILFLCMMGASVWTLLRVRWQSRKIPGMEWCVALAGVGMSSIAILMTCGAFISIAFQPEMYYAVALSVMLGQHVRRVRDSIRLAAEREGQPRYGAASGAGWDGALA